MAPTIGGGTKKRVPGETARRGSPGGDGDVLARRR